MRRINLDNINTVLVVRFSSLGDVLLSTPLLRSLKLQYPSVNIDFLVREEFSDAVKLNPHINRVHKLTRSNNTASLIADLKTSNYDLVIDLQNNFRSRRIVNKISSDVVRFNKPSIRKFLLVKLKINLLKDSPSIPERYAGAVEELKLDGGGLDLNLPDESDTKLDEHKKYIGFCPGSKHFTKQWPMEYFIELGNLIKGSGFDVVLLGGKDDLEICEIICEQISGAVNLCNDNDLFKTASEMKQCDVIICNDSGLMHTATAVRIPVISIFGSTVREFGFSPYRSKNLILENNLLSCRPCSHIGRSECPKKHFKCMKELTAQNVFEQFNKFYNSL